MRVILLIVAVLLIIVIDEPCKANNRLKIKMEKLNNSLNATEFMLKHCKLMYTGK